MGGMFLVRPETVAFVSATAGGASVANLLTPDPKEVWAHPGYPGFEFATLDLGATMMVDSFFFGFIAGAANPAIKIAVAQEGSGLVPIGDVHRFAPTTRRGLLRRHVFVRSAPVPGRFIQFGIDPNQTGGGAVTVGIAAVGLAFEPRRNREWGGGRRPIDTGSVEPLPGGGFGIGDGIVKSSFRWTWGDLDDDELDRLDELAMDCGNRRPTLVAEQGDPARLRHQDLHYGLLDRFEFYERADVGKSRWGMGITDWA